MTANGVATSPAETYRHFLISRGAPPPRAAVAYAPELASNARLLSERFEVPPMDVLTRERFVRRSTHDLVCVCDVLF